MAVPAKRIDPAGLEARLPLLAEKMSAFPEVAAVYLYGSFARGRPRRLSDVDIAVLVGGDGKNRDPLAILNYVGAAVDALETDRVDLVILNEVPVVLRHEIFRHGRAVFVHDREALSRFREASMREYLDTIPLRREYAEAYFRRIRESGFAR